MLFLCSSAHGLRCAIMLFALALVVLLAIRLLRRCLTYKA